MAARKRKKRILAEEIAGVVLIAFAVLLALGIFTSSDALVLDTFKQICWGVFGAVSYILPIAMVALGVYLLLFADKKRRTVQIVCYVIIAVCFLCIVHLIFVSKIASANYGDFITKSYDLGRVMHEGAGGLGAIFTYPCLELFGTVGSYIFLIAAGIISALIGTNLSFREVKKDTSAKLESMRKDHERKRELRVQQKRQNASEEDLYNADDYYHQIEEAPVRASRYRHTAATGECKSHLKVFTIEPEPERIAGSRVADSEDDIDFIPGMPHASHLTAPYAPWQEEEETAGFDDCFTDDEMFAPQMQETESAEESLEAPHAGRTVRAVPHAEEKTQRSSVVVEQREESDDRPPVAQPQQEIPYEIPPISMLPRPAKFSAKDARQAQMDSRANAVLLERTLQEFNVNAKVINVCSGPTVTRYEVQPAPGVRVNRITNLADDIALALAASGVRIEAPIPGKNAIGIEVPNRNRTTVTLREILEGEAYQKGKEKSKVTIVLGKDIAGNDIVVDLAKMPHLLIAGTTGSGKSVCVNTLVMSMLFEATPEELQLIIVDPKMVEFGAYNGIPHLRIPVVTDAKKAAGALQSAVGEMVKRYNAFAEKGAKDIGRYNDIMRMNEEPILPYLVVIIDELADLMMVAAKEVEDYICRIAQMGRAAGIHMIIATQSPRVDVITGLIKANFPSRIGLTVGSQTDSRVILDQGGAEKLTGNGDMLFSSASTPKPVRIQGPFVSAPEIDAITAFIKKQSGPPSYDEEMIEQINHAAEEKEKGAPGKPDADDEETKLLCQAIEIFLDAGQGSTSALQRRLRIGYGRAARLLDEMENMGIIGPPDGPRPRKVLITRMEYDQMFNNDTSVPEEI